MLPLFCARLADTEGAASGQGGSRWGADGGAGNESGIGIGSG